MGVKGVVHIVDDDAAYREALMALFEGADIQSYAYANAQEFLGANLPDQPSCILLDYQLGKQTGLSLQKKMIADRRAIPILFLSGVASVSIAVTALKGGAIDFLEKPVDNSILISKVKETLKIASQSYVASRVYNALSKRERDVFWLLVSGNSNKAIAHQLELAEVTVEYHRKNIFKKTCSTNVAELVSLSRKVDFN